MTVGAAVEAVQAVCCTVRRHTVQRIDTQSLRLSPRFFAVFI